MEIRLDLGTRYADGKPGSKNTCRHYEGKSIEEVLSILKDGIERMKENDPEMYKSIFRISLICEGV